MSRIILYVVSICILYVYFPFPSVPISYHYLFLSIYCGKTYPDKTLYNAPCCHFRYLEVYYSSWGLPTQHPPDRMNLCIHDMSIISNINKYLKLVLPSSDLYTHHLGPKSISIHTFVFIIMIQKCFNVIVHTVSYCLIIRQYSWIKD